MPNAPAVVAHPPRANFRRAARHVRVQLRAPLPLRLPPQLLAVRLLIQLFDARRLGGGVEARRDARERRVRRVLVRDPPPHEVEEEEQRRGGRCVRARRRARRPAARSCGGGPVRVR